MRNPVAFFFCPQMNTNAEITNADIEKQFRLVEEALLRNDPTAQSTEVEKLSQLLAAAPPEVQARVASRRPPPTPAELIQLFADAVKVGRRVAEAVRWFADR